MNVPTSVLSLETEIVACSQQVSCDIGDETVVLTLEDGVYYALNPVASLVWKSIQERKKVKEIRDLLIESYEVEPDQCTEDVFALLHQMIEWKLIETENGGN